MSARPSSAGGPGRGRRRQRRLSDSRASALTFSRTLAGAAAAVTGQFLSCPRLAASRSQGWLIAGERQPPGMAEDRQVPTCRRACSRPGSASARRT